MASRVTRRFFSTTVRRLQDSAQKQELKKETKRNPELMVRHNTTGQTHANTFPQRWNGCAVWFLDDC